MAAVLTFGSDAVLSHTSAAALWHLLPQPSAAGSNVSKAPAHVTVPGRAGHRHRPGVRVHHSVTLTPANTTRRNNIPVTTPSRTLRDLRRTLPEPQFAKALRQAEYLGLPVTGLDPDHTRSELEARFLAICRRHRLPKPEVNVRIGPHLVDFLWRDAHLVAELDGYGAHGGREAFEADRARDVDLKLFGFEVVRFTWRRVTTSPSGIAATLRSLLRSGGQ
jgi:very-short-patch-repair endonuclease